MIDTKKLWLTLLASWGFTLMGLFNIIVLCVLATMLAARFSGAVAIELILMPSFAFMILMFMLGEVVVNFLFGAESPDPVKDARVIRALARVKKKARLWVKPRLWILSIGGVPNAMAYGPGIPFLAAIGVSRELVDMLTDDELEAVLAHEVGHIKCRDTGILSVISLLIGIIDKLRGALQTRTSLLAQSPILLVVGWVIYAIGRVAFYISRFSISQERELAADALSASYMGSVEPLIRGLSKLHDHSGKSHADESDKPIFHDLMVSHPGLEERIASLRMLVKTETATA